MTKVIFAGAAGRMETRITSFVNRHPELDYSAEFEAAGSVAPAWIDGKPNRIYTRVDVLGLQNL